MATGKPKIEYLESIRGIAAITVAFLHAKSFANASPLTANAWVDNASLMVDFFFVLSGYVIALTYLDRITDRRALISFQWKRFLRLYPLHLVTLIGFVGIEVAKYVYEQKTGISATNPAFSSNDLSAFINNLFLTQALFGEQITFNYPSWSISTEFYTYAVFGLTCWAVSAGRAHLFSVLIVIAVSGFILWASGATSPTVGVAVFRCLYAFFIGVLLHYIARARKWPVAGWASYLLIALAIVLVLYGKSIPHLFYPPLFALMILSMLHSPDNGLKRALEWRPLVYLGTISYGIYMIHAGVWWAINQVFRVLYDVPGYQDSETGHLRLDIADPYATITLLAGIGIVIAVSSVSYRYMEKPVSGLARQKARMSGMPTPSALS